MGWLRTDIEQQTDAELLAGSEQSADVCDSKCKLSDKRVPGDVHCAQRKNNASPPQSIHHLRENHLVLGRHHCLLRGTICPTFLEITILLHLQGHHLSSLAETQSVHRCREHSSSSFARTPLWAMMVYDRQIVNVTTNTRKK